MDIDDHQFKASNLTKEDNEKACKKEEKEEEFFSGCYVEPVK